VASLIAENTFYTKLSELLLAEFPQEAWTNKGAGILGQETFGKQRLLQAILEKKITGFVTVKGGRESPSLRRKMKEDAEDVIEIVDDDDDSSDVFAETEVEKELSEQAATRFGFCVQNYAPLPCEISFFTKKQISDFHGWTDPETGEMDEKRVDDYISKQPPRTLNSGTFHAEETVSTTYLTWLIEERGFCDFDITHFIEYKFSDCSRLFLEPVLQQRHEYKKAGNSVAA
jgi:nitrogen regulatory protein PII-like uncharacterized protein